MELNFNGALITSITVYNEIGQQEIEAAIVEFSIGKCRCAGEIKVLKEKLTVCRAKIKELSIKITDQQQQPYTLSYCENL